MNLGSITPTGSAPDGITAESLTLYTRSIKAASVTTPTVIDTLSPFIVQTV